MGDQINVRELHEAAREEWIATKAAIRCRRTEILDKTRESLSGGADPDRDVLPELYRDLSAERMVDASIGFIVTHVGESMVLGFIEGFPASVIQRCLKLDFGQAICGTVARSGRGMHVTDIQRSIDPLSELVRSAGINAYACEPLVAGERLLGTLSFASRTRRRFDGEDLEFFRAIAICVAAARERIDQGFQRRQASRSFAGRA